ncbi:hypothetical protein EZL54_26940, partial [Salmonella enterica]|nr:hypothetical protein [Salmonella enterica]
MKFNIAFFCFFMSLFCGHANGTVLFKKYTYGALIGGYHNVRISKITENDDNYVTFLTGKKLDKKEDDVELFVMLKTRAVGNKVLASTTFKNKSYYDR